MGENVFGCACLNVRVHAETVAEDRTALEDNTNALSTLAEVKTGSSIDPNINMVRCELCKTTVLYFRSPRASLGRLQQQQQPKQMPGPQTTVYLAEDARGPDAVAEIEQQPEYSQPFGVLLDPSVVGASRVRPGGHIPRDLQLRCTEFMQRQETRKNERVRVFIRRQDEEIERVRKQTMKQGAMVAEFVARAHPQAVPTSQGGSNGSAGAGAGASGLAAMLRGSDAGSVPRGSPFGHSYSPGVAAAARRTEQSSEEDSGDAYDLNDPGFGAPSGLAAAMGRVSLGRRSNSQSELSEDGEPDRSDSRASSGVDMHPQPPQRSGNLSQMLAGSMPIQIPMYGNSLTGEPSMSRRELYQRAGEQERNKRREQILKGMPKTFVPLHELLDQMNEDDPEMVIGSKPKDSYGMFRRHAPG
ncbi:hypothetical protein GGF46_004389 [Coemansia sp. RSA 552]|nr:hypothetical protein GGF46_004389 [Coemansia sp. RSA 552]